MKKYLLVILLGINQITFSQNDVSPKLSEYIQRINDLERFSGVVLVQKGNEVLLKKSYGIANIENKKSITLETAFDIGSISKQFTAAAILKLCDQNKIKLEEPINSYLGEFASDNWENVTVHHLLSHQSGIPSILQSGQGLDDYWPKETPVTWEKQISYFKDLKLIDKPGKEYRYNNTGYVLLALIVEKVSGKTFSNYMAEEVFQSNGLNGTSVGCSDLSTCARNHYYYPKSLMELAPEYHMSWYRGAGGVYSTIIDLNAWISALYYGDILSDKSRTAMFTKQAKNYGYGWVIEERDGKETIHHDGTNFGSTSFVLIVPSQEIQIVILTNQTHKELHKLGKSESWIRKIAYDLLDISNKKSVDLPPQKAQQYNEADLENYLGTYSFHDSVTFSINQKDQSLFFQPIEMKYSIYRHFAYNEINNNSSPILVKAKNASEAISKNKFWKFGRYCNAEMKFVSYSGILSLGYKSIVKDLGEIERTMVYEVGTNYAKAKFFGKNGNMDFILYFNKENEIKGIFDIGYSEIINAESVKLKIISGNRLFIDGFSDGEIDSVLKLEHLNGQEIIRMTQNGREFIAVKQK